MAALVGTAHPHTGRARGRHGQRGGHLLLAIGVAVEAGAGLAADQAAHRADRRDGRRAVAGFLVELVVDGFHHRVRDVQPGQVHQLEGAHAEAGLLAHDGVDIGEAGHAFLRHLQAFDVHAAAGMVDDEAGHVLAAHRGVAQAARQCHQRIAHGRVAGQAVDHLDHLHQRHGIEEVVACDAARLLGADRDRGDRQRGGVGGDHGIRAQDGFQLRHQVALDFQLLDNGLEHHVAAGQVVQRGAGHNARQRGSAFLGTHLALVGQLGEGVLQVLAGCGHGLRVGIVEADGQAGLRGDLRNAAAHGAGADDAYRVDAESAHSASRKVWLN